MAAIANNIYRCRICKRMLISEELDIHICKDLQDYKFNDSILNVFDGDRWYSLKLSRLSLKSEHPKFTPEDGTESNNNNNNNNNNK